MTAEEKNLLALYRTMVTIRQFETRAGELFAAGRIPGFIHLSLGQEASAVGVCSCLRPDDYLTTTHRGHGHIIAKGADLKKMMAELFGRRTGYCKGKGGSMHIADFSLGILGANGVVAGGLPIIAGAGFSIRMRHTDQVAVCFFGDGAANRGPVHEVMNLAAVWKLPVVFVVENNQFASTTAHRDACAVEDISRRATGYNMPGATVDGNDLLQVRQAAKTAVERARRGDGPSLLENRTYRIRGHFEGDPQKYRRPVDVETWQNDNDPITRFSRFLMRENVLTADFEKKIRDAVAVELTAAVEFAEQSPWPEPEQALEDLLV
ncbi:MAG: thiamine pyrophosphate-dependent dehydrogenase E1 component subunit alpha [Desulfobacterales bacterium]